MNGLYFALRSGAEHRQLRHDPCQIELMEKHGERAYLVYKEDISKNHPGGLKGRKHKPTVVVHHANLDNPSRCFVRLFKKYCDLCPPDRPRNAFYLAPLRNYTTHCWFSRSAVGHNTLKSSPRAKMNRDEGKELSPLGLSAMKRTQGRHCSQGRNATQPLTAPESHHPPPNPRTRLEPNPPPTPPPNVRRLTPRLRQRRTSHAYTTPVNSSHAPGRHRSGGPAHRTLNWTI